MEKKYSILTYNFGGYEVLHEVKMPQNDVEYIYVTDDPTLKSNTWKIVIDDSLKDMSPFDKCYAVRFNPFKYCSTDVCIRLDGSIVIGSSPDKLIEKFNNEKYDLALCPHPDRYTITDEYAAWIELRNYSPLQAAKCIHYMIDHNYDFTYKSMIQQNFVIQRKCKQNDQIDKMTYNLLKELGSDGKIERVDQIITSYILNTYFRDIRIMPLSELIVHSSMFGWCAHGQSIPWRVQENNEKYYKSYLFNKLVNLITPKDL